MLNGRPQRRIEASRKAQYLSLVGNSVIFLLLKGRRPKVKFKTSISGREVGESVRSNLSLEHVLLHPFISFADLTAIYSLQPILPTRFPLATKPCFPCVLVFPRQRQWEYYPNCLEQFLKLCVCVQINRSMPQPHKNSPKKRSCRSGPWTAGYEGKGKEKRKSRPGVQATIETKDQNNSPKEKRNKKIKMPIS